MAKDQNKGEYEYEWIDDEQSDGDFSMFVERSHCDEIIGRR